MDFLCEYSVLQRRQKLFSVQECLPVDSKHTCLRDICWETESQYVCSKYIVVSEIQGVLCFFFCLFFISTYYTRPDPKFGCFSCHTISQCFNLCSFCYTCADCTPASPTDIASCSSSCSTSTNCSNSCFSTSNGTSISCPPSWHAYSTSR